MLLKERIRERGGLAVIAVFNTVLGVALFVQPDSFAATPAYAELLQILPQQWWGTIFLLVAAAMWVSVWCHRNQLLGVGAHTVALALCIVWLLAFLLRTAYNPATTVVNPLNWSIQALVLIFSAFQMDHNGTPPPRDEQR